MAGEWPQVILHADMDAFYAAVEQLDDASLRGRPVIVGHDSDRGVVLTASYEARVSGVGSAMPMVRARRRCPDAIIVAPRFERYQQLSATIMRVFTDFSPRVEPLSLDEAFLDITGTRELLGEPRELALDLKRAVREATRGLTVSVGVSATKFVAKVASAYHKPDGLTIVPPGEAQAWLALQPISRLWGVGPKTAKRLHALGIVLIRDLDSVDPTRLESALGRAAPQLLSLAKGLDPRSVRDDRKAITIGSERTFARDIADKTEIANELHHAADEVARRLRHKHCAAHGVRIKLKTHDFRVVTRQGRLPLATDLGAELHQAALRLLESLDEPGPFRLAGLTAYEIGDRRRSGQQALSFAVDDKTQRLETALDRLRDRFGADSIRRGSTGAVRGIGGGVNLDFIDDEPD